MDGEDEQPAHRTPLCIIVARVRRRVPQVVVGVAAATLALLAPGAAPADPTSALPPLLDHPPGPCPGAASCPYVATAIVGDRDGGVLRLPQAVAVAPDGTTFVGDQYSHAVQRFAPDGTFELAFGSFGRGPGELRAVGGLALGADGTVYVVDAGNSRIQRFTRDGAYLGSFGSRGSALGKFNFGLGRIVSQGAGGGVAVNGSSVFVADTLNHRVQIFDLDGSRPRVLGARGRAAGQFDTPQGVWATDNAVYVADDRNHRVHVFNRDGTFRKRLGRGRGSGPGRLEFPYDVAVDAAGSAYVADNLNHRVNKYDRRGRFVRSIGTGFGRGPSQLAFVRGLTVARDQLYVADTANGRVSVFSARGRLLRHIGRDGRAPGQFISPAGISATPDGGLAVADRLNSRIHQLGPDGGVLAVYGGLGSAAHKLDLAAGVAVDGSFRSWIADSANNRLVRRSFHGSPVATFGGPGQRPGRFSAPADVAVGVTGDVYVADTGNDRIQVLDPGGELRRTIGPRVSDEVPPLARPGGVAVSSAGDVYVADTGNDRIVRLDRSGGYVGAWGSIDGPARLRGPSGVAVDAAGDVYVADSGQHQIEKFSADGRPLLRWGELGHGPGQFNRPEDVAVDCNGVVSVSDRENHRVQRFTMAVPSAAACQPTPAAPPRLTVGLERRDEMLPRGGAVLLAACADACQVQVHATLRSVRGGAAARLSTRERRLPAGERRRLRMTLTRAGARRLGAALGDRSGPLALHVTVHATAPGAVSRTTVVRTYRVRR